MKKSAAIRAVGVSKEYKLGTVTHNFLTGNFLSFLQQFSGASDPDDADTNGVLAANKTPMVSSSSAANNRFLAVDDVSFDVFPGDAMGIIGANGAGKSTLLKLVSRVTLPSKGKILIRGRILSMLEVGTGFNPQLTGRNNVYMNGLILGMKKHEISEKFDEIVEFSGIGKFIDTPVKRYSSGMQVRLAFSVAAHFVPEIIIIDEVLSVGDAEFQRKCLDKMEEVLRQGRAILFVSHNMETVASFCNKGLWMDKGKTQFYGSATDAILKYESSISKDKDLFETHHSAENEASPIGNQYVNYLSASLLDEGRRRVERYNIEDTIIVQMKYRVLEKSAWIAQPLFRFNRMDGTCAFVSSPPNQSPQEPGEYIVECIIPGNLLNDGVYYIDIIFGSHLDGAYLENFVLYRSLTIRIRDPFDELNRLRFGNSASVLGTMRPTETIKWNVDKS